MESQSWCIVDRPSWRKEEEHKYGLFFSRPSRLVCLVRASKKVLKRKFQLKKSGDGCSKNFHAGGLSVVALRLGTGLRGICIMLYYSFILFSYRTILTSTFWLETFWSFPFLSGQTRNKKGSNDKRSFNPTKRYTQYIIPSSISIAPAFVSVHLLRKKNHYNHNLVKSLGRRRRDEP